MTTKSITRASNGQKDQVAAIVGALVKSLMGEMDVDSEGAQKGLIEDAGAFKATLREPLMAAIRAHGTTNQFANEEVESSYGYLSGYQKARPAVEQMTAFKAAFPQLGSYDTILAAQEALDGTEGNFLIPDWRAIAPTYGEAVELVLAALKKSRNGRFVNYRDGQLGPNRFKEGAKKVAAFQKLREEQKGHNVLVIQAQFGIRHRGKSVRRARVVMGGNEFGLGAFEIGCMLLSHPERLQHYDDLWIDCAGDEYAPAADGDFCYAPCFDFRVECLKFSTRVVVDPGDGCGSASAFVASAVPSE